MADSPAPLSDEERAELETLRAEKSREEELRRAQRERAELARLKAERERALRDAQASARAREIRERNSKLMEPDDDLRMPLGQRAVLVVLTVLTAAIVASMMVGR
ncbi:hypothetical protein [Olsenella uli]|mgnify:FL=1|uniref:hypothetical protein n=1 Tax=Olsenella uli TaxID=133926 RepID=UPI00241FD308|nr:hypothetical protein [Olsenella uli]